MERLGTSGERPGGVLARPGSVLGRLGAVLVAFKGVLGVKMSFESVQKPKTFKIQGLFKVFGRVPRRLGACWDAWGASWGRLGASWERLGPSWGRLGTIFKACHLGSHVLIDF